MAATIHVLLVDAAGGALTLVQERVAGRQLGPLGALAGLLIGEDATAAGRLQRVELARWRFWPAVETRA